MFADEEGFEPLSDVWLSILTGMTIALLVNVVSNFRLEVLPIIQVSLLFIASIFIGLYARKKSEGLSVIERRIDRENKHGRESALERQELINEEWDERHGYLKKVMIGNFLLLSVSVCLLFFQGWIDRRANEVEIKFRIYLEDSVKQLFVAVDSLKMELNKQTVEKQSGQTSPKSNANPSEVSNHSNIHKTSGKQ